MFISELSRPPWHIASGRLARILCNRHRGLDVNRFMVTPCKTPKTKHIPRLCLHVFAADVVEATASHLCVIGKEAVFVNPLGRNFYVGLGEPEEQEFPTASLREDACCVWSGQEGFVGVGLRPLSRSLRLSVSLCLSLARKGCRSTLPGLPRLSPFLLLLRDLKIAARKHHPSTRSVCFFPSLSPLPLALSLRLSSVFLQPSVCLPSFLPPCNLNRHRCSCLSRSFLHTKPAEANGLEPARA